MSEFVKSDPTDYLHGSAGVAALCDTRIMTSADKGLLIRSQESELQSFRHMERSGLKLFGSWPTENEIFECITGDADNVNLKFWSRNFAEILTTLPR